MLHIQYALDVDQALKNPSGSKVNERVSSKPRDRKAAATHTP